MYDQINVSLFLSLSLTHTLSLSLSLIFSSSSSFAHLIYFPSAWNFHLSFSPPAFPCIHTGTLFGFQSRDTSYQYGSFPSSVPWVSSCVKPHPHKHPHDVFFFPELSSILYSYDNSLKIWRPDAWCLSVCMLLQQILFLLLPTSIIYLLLHFQHVAILGRQVRLCLHHPSHRPLDLVIFLSCSHLLYVVLLAHAILI